MIEHGAPFTKRLEEPGSEGGEGQRDKYAYVATKNKRNSKVRPGILCLLVVSASILRACCYELLQYERFGK
jgi:hypothetical protein